MGGYAPAMSFIETRQRWGFSPEKLRKHNLFASPQMFCDIYCLEPGQAQKAHAPEGASKFYFVLEGEGHFSVGGESRTLGPGGLAYALSGEPHGVENRSGARLVLLVSMAPNPGA